MINVKWGNDLAELAHLLFTEILGEKDPFRKDCIIVSSPTTEAWLKQYFLFEMRSANSQSVLANVEFKPLYVFVNDWLLRMDRHGGGKQREAKYHPYSRECMQWRLYRLLDDADAGVMSELRRYMNSAKETRDLRRYGLAGMIARLFDEYQSYRPDMLLKWEKKAKSDGAEKHPWQPELWRRLIVEDDHSYLSYFTRIVNELGRVNIWEEYRTISIFGVESMPPVYVHFLQHLGMDVDQYVFNPCREQWDQDLTPREAARLEVKCDLGGRPERTDEESGYMDCGNPLLSSLGKGCQAYLGELVDRTGGEISAKFKMPDDKTILHVIQNDILMRRTVSGAGGADARGKVSVRPGDESISIQICHSPMREVEVLKDHIYRWFESDPGLQPRHIQVMVGDIARYAPYIEAVFAAQERNAPWAIPYVIADRSLTSTSRIADAFMLLLDMPRGRYKASAILDVLSNGAVMESFGLEEQDVADIRGMVADSGIRWGLDGESVREAVKVDMGDTFTWKRGIDRMLLGYAMGGDDGGPEAGLLSLGTVAGILPNAAMEGRLAELAGKLGRFIHCLEEMSGRLAESHSPEDWEKHLTLLIDTFFRSGNETYVDVNVLRKAVRDFKETASAGGVKKLPREVMTKFMEEHLESCPPSHSNVTGNAVMFTSLRVMKSMPRRFICLLGVDDGVFPRTNTRPVFDLISLEHRRGDRNNRLDDRLAFLEALMSARECFYISYTGRTDKDNEKMPPSTVVGELKDYMQSSFILPPETATEAGDSLMYCERLNRLQAFHPDYFSRKGGNGGGSGLFSYSSADYAAACCLVGTPKEVGVSAAVPAVTPPVPLDSEPAKLENMVRFLRNPAEYFYKNVLKVDLKALTQDGTDDNEPVEPDALEAYSLNLEILKVMTSAGGAAGDPARMAPLMLEKGLIPPGPRGREYMERQWQELKNYLDSELDVAGTAKCMRDILAGMVAAQPTSCRLGSGDDLLTGSVRLLDMGKGGDRCQVFARYTEVKAKDYVAAWCYHLFACATQDHGRVRTYVIGKTVDSKDYYDHMESLAASQELSGLLALYRRGLAQVIPFAPQTSYLYVKKDSLGAAAGGWFTDTYKRGDDADPYMWKAFGPDGPMNCQGFQEVARSVFLNLIGYFGAAKDEGRRDNDAT